MLWFRASLIVLGFSPFLALLLELVAAVEALPAPLNRLANTLASGVGTVLGSACHAVEARSLSVGSALLPVCARCTGIYIGLAAGAIVPRSRTPRNRLIALLCATLFLLALDVATELVALRPASAPLRLLTGSLVGIYLSRLATSHIRQRNTAARPAGYRSRAQGLHGKA